MGIRTIFDPERFRCRYLATAEEQAQLGCLLQFINHFAPHSARTNFDPHSHDLRSPTPAQKRESMRREAGSQRGDQATREAFRANACLPYPMTKKA
jgi:hypothetical protein